MPLWCAGDCSLNDSYASGRPLNSHFKYHTACVYRMSGTKRLASFFILKHVIQNCQPLRLHSSSKSEWMNESINQSIKIWMNEWSTLSIGKMMTDKTKSTWGEGGPNPCLALSTTNLKCYGLGQRHGLSVTGWCLPRHTAQKSEDMSSLNFYCVPPPPSTAVMLHSRHSKHCNTVLVQSQHTAQSVEHGYWI
jgi:hypothetical protein